MFCIFEHDPRLHSNIVKNLRLKRIIAVWILIFISVCNLYIRPDLTTMFEAFGRWRKVGQKDIPSLGDMIHWRYEICWRHFFKYGRGLKLKIQSDDLSGPLWDPRHHFHMICWIYQPSNGSRIKGQKNLCAPLIFSCWLILINVMQPILNVLFSFNLNSL